MIDDLIYDVGMHRGYDTDFYLKKGFRVIAVEANPDLCAEVSNRHSAAINNGRLTILNLAIVEHPGEVDLFLSQKNTEWTTVHEDWVARNRLMGDHVKTIKVEGQTFKDILSQYGVPYFLKIDIEGSDVFCLDALRDFSERPRLVSIESIKTSWPNLVAEFDLLQALGYCSFKVVNQAKVHLQKPPAPPLEGTHCDHQFGAGSSGLFGDEAPGRWVSRSQALLKYRWIYAKYAAFGNYGIFQNLHKRVKNPLLKTLVRPGWYDTHAVLDSGKHQ